MSNKENTKPTPANESHIQHNKEMVEINNSDFIKHVFSNVETDVVKDLDIMKMTGNDEK